MEKLPSITVSLLRLGVLHRFDLRRLICSWAASAANGESGKKDDKNGGKKKTKLHVIEEDPEGKEHLEEAKKYAALLVRRGPKRMSAWALQYDVSVRRGKLLALQVSRRDASLKLDWISIGMSSNWAWTLIVSILEPQAPFKMRSVDVDDHRLFSRVVDCSQRLTSRALGDREKGNAVAEEVVGDASQC